MAKSYAQLNFRVDSQLAGWLKEFAQSNRYSMTTQLIIILEQERDRQTQGNKKADTIRQDELPASETTI